MTTLAPTPPISFVVRLPHFEGSLAELASALRTGRVGPGEVGLLTLTREVLSWAQSQGVEGHPEALPTLAHVIALKARLLLPQPEHMPEANEDGQFPSPQSDFTYLLMPVRLPG